MNHLRASGPRYCMAGWARQIDGWVRQTSEGPVSVVARIRDPRSRGWKEKCRNSRQKQRRISQERKQFPHPKPRMMNLAGHVVPTWAAPPETYAIKPSHKPFPMASAVESLTFVCSEFSCRVIGRDVMSRCFWELQRHDAGIVWMSSGK